MENKKSLKIGSSDFKTIIEDNGYFVDKTMLIKGFFEASSYILLMPRPKRFGKTLNLSMIEHFFDARKPESAKLFSGFEISKELDFCKQHQNKYPVINITLKDIDETTWEKCLANFTSTISKLYKQHDYLLDSNKLKIWDKQTIEKIISKTASEIEYKESLEALSGYLCKHFDEKVIVLVDEYDAPIINAYKNTTKPIKGEKGKTTYYEELISFLQMFLGKAYKGNDNNLKKGLLTGVMRIGRESIFSKWNNFDVFGITSTYYADSFGFTQQETGKILNYFGLRDKVNDVEKWYNGYQFGNVNKIYNPWSIVNYISKKDDGFKAYWVNASDDSLIKERLVEPNIKEHIQELISGKTITKTIRENFVFPDFEHKTELLWTLLLYGGFLTKTKNISLNRYELVIPNHELKFVFTDLILDWIEKKYKFNQDLLITATNNLINNNIPGFEKGFKQIIGDTLSYFDVAPIKDKEGKKIIVPQEQFFHVYTLGLLAILSDDYIIKSNRESGDGRYDIVLIPRHANTPDRGPLNGIIIEIKHVENQQENESFDDFGKRINNKIGEALEQIERKKYYKELLAHEIELEKIKRVPIVFAGKEPYVCPVK